MSKEWVVLHITDFHISDPASITEHLRENYFREYLDKLVNAIRKHDVIGKKLVDAIVITGDFINYGNKGGLANARFIHAKKVIDYLCKKLDFDLKLVFVCNGNHDVDHDLEVAGDQAGARKEYESFISDFGNGARGENDVCRSNLVKTTLGAHVLLIDSTLGAKGENCPGIISAAEIDEVVAKVRNAELSKGELLIVASHHPAFPFVTPDAPFDESKTDWPEKHIWRSANPLYLRLKDSLQEKGSVLWLSGDIHRDDYIIEGPMHSVVTGRLGTDTGRASHVRRQARVILLTQQGESRSWICEFVPLGHNDQAQTGGWQVSEKPPMVYGQSEQKLKAESSPIAELSPVSMSTQQLHVEKNDFPTSKCNQVSLLSDELQETILSSIEKKELYIIGRFATSETESTMAWIPMSALLDQDELLSALVTAMAKEVKKEVADTKADNPIIIGLDSWGAILASQVSVMTGVKNFCIAGRAEGMHHSASERISNTVKAGVLGCDLIILISDVIGTGNALKGVYDALSKGMSEKQKEQAKWSLLSVICDDKHDRKCNLHFAHINMTACKDLRIPILLNDDLPSEAILPADISFVRH